MLTEKQQKRGGFLIDFAYFVACLAIFMSIFIALKYTFAWCLPFIIGLIIATILRRPSEFIARKTKIPRKLVSYAMLFLFYAVIAVILWLVGAKIVGMVRGSMTSFSDTYEHTIAPALDQLNTFITDIVANFSPSIRETSPTGVLGGLMDNLAGQTAGLRDWGIGKAVDLGMKVPSFLLGFLFTILASAFFAGDYKKITTFVSAQFPPKVQSIVLEIKGYLFGTLGKYLKSYLIILCITFVELSIGFTVIGIKSSILIAFLVAICDILPVLGTGTIVIPWAAVALVTGNFLLAAELIIIYVIVTIIRNIIEPKIVGQQLGLHPIVTLFCIFIGLRLMGVLGMFAVPITVQIIVRLNKSGTFNFIKLPGKAKEEEETK